MKRSSILFILNFLISIRNATADFDPNMMDQVCPPFRCSRGTVPVPKRRLQFSSSGCNSMSGATMFNPNESKGPSVKCCDIRNACYQICGATKDFCDEQMQKCNTEVCNELPNAELKESCEKQASINVALTKFGGCRDYDAAQNSSCDCVKKDDAPERRKKVLERFYEKHAPDSLQKVEALAQKADSTKKLAALLTKLITKYPNAIKRIEDPNQRLMDDLMKGRKGFEENEVFDEDKPDDEALDIDEL